MNITSKSLYNSNIVFVFEEGNILLPDNSILTSLYRGKEAAGARFVDHLTLNTKILDLPELKIKIVTEPSRLRIEDLSQENPDNSKLIQEANNVYQKLFSQSSLIGFGFNFDLYYRFDNLIQVQELFKNLVNQKILNEADLRDLGIQFTLDKDGGKKQEIYFVKITAPFEIAVHANHHFRLKKLPGQNEIERLFKKCYANIDPVIENLQF